MNNFVISFGAILTEERNISKKWEIHNYQGLPGFVSNIYRRREPYISRKDVLNSSMKALLFCRGGSLLTFQRLQAGGR